MSDGNAAAMRMEATQPKISLTEAIGCLEALAEHVFGEKDLAITWLRRSNLSTDDVPPLDLLREPNGFERIKNVLLRIEYGVLA